MSDPELRITRRKLPHWHLTGATYFITSRLRSGELSSDERRLVLEHIVSGDPVFYELIAVQVMPNHVHALLSPQPPRSLSDVLKGIKGVTARKVNRLRGTKGRLWQDESFDRIVRDTDELLEKLHYMLNNPLKHGSVEDPFGYEGWHMKE